MADTPYKEPINSVPTNHHSENEHQNASPILGTEPQIPRSAINTHQPEQKRKDRLERWKFYVEILTLIAISVYAFIAYYQWEAMRDATEATKKSADAAKDAVQIAKDTLKANREGMEANLRQSKTALDASIEMAHQEQRAWVGPINVIPPHFIDGSHAVFVKEGGKPAFGIIIINSGKTPAKNVRSIQHVKILPANVRLVPDFTPQAIQERSGIFTVHPGMKYPLEVPSPKVPFTKEQIDALRNGQTILYQYGMITYEDIFGKTHKTTFCMQMTNDLADMHGCKSYNEAD